MFKSFAVIICKVLIVFRCVFLRPLIISHDVHQLCDRTCEKSKTMRKSIDGYLQFLVPTAVRKRVGWFATLSSVAGVEIGMFMVCANTRRTSTYTDRYRRRRKEHSRAMFVNSLLVLDFRSDEARDRFKVETNYKCVTWKIVVRRIHEHFDNWSRSQGKSVYLHVRYIVLKTSQDCYPSSRVQRIARFVGVPRIITVAPRKL
jgi:hypothetical protein